MYINIKYLSIIAKLRATSGPYYIRYFPLTAANNLKMNCLYLTFMKYDIYIIYLVII